MWYNFYDLLIHNKKKENMPSSPNMNVSIPLKLTMICTSTDASCPAVFLQWRRDITDAPA